MTYQLGWIGLQGTHRVSQLSWTSPAFSPQVQANNLGLWVLMGVVNCPDASSCSEIENLLWTFDWRLGKFAVRDQKHDLMVNVESERATSQNPDITAL